MAANLGICVKNPAHPGGFIKNEIIEPLGLSVTGAADVLGVTRATLSTLLNERAYLSSEWRCASRRPLAFRWIRSCGCRTATTLPRPASGKGRSRSRPTRASRLSRNRR
ncbi:hypothetical protein [Nitrosovibrio tenuis]|uniref:Addiction module antidote protein, HigA family n=1 Tax=Nitrosovibrio tenuis TaxID=1233 RepID=A0A1H7N194_9PROT|nr:hypothetical protein [Nitrosovibrio tenuis]SEL16705.1 addiction module antidote protein, HigA family [Nitrosovibrio tenuis]